MRFFYYLFIFIVLYSCNEKSSYIQQAEKIIDHYPDSALLLLDSVLHPNLLSESDLNKYTLLKIKAKDKLYQNITQDTAIFKTAVYFSKKNDLLRTSQANYYCGRLYHESGINRTAINFYLEANRYIELLQENYNQKGVIQMNIGYLLFKDSEYIEALAYFTNALDYFIQEGNIANEVSANLEIGNCHIMLNNQDSAYIYYNKTLSLAEASDLPHIRLWALQSLALIYQVQSDCEKAINLNHEILSLSTDSMKRAQVYLGLSRVYQEKGQIDSMNHYLNKSLEASKDISDPYYIASLYSIFSEVHEKASNYKKALADYKIYTDNLELISSEKEEKAILDIQEKYQFEQIRNANNELYIKNSRYFIGSLLLVFAFIVSLVTYHFILTKKKRLLDEAENKILQLDNLALSYNENRDSFRDILLHHFNILKKSAMIHVNLREDEIRQGEKLLNKFNDIVYKQEGLDWNVLYSTMNRLHDGFLDKLKRIILNLDESEFRICCLIYTDFTNQEIGIILKLSTSTITHKRHSIRKKMGLEEYGNIYERLKILSEEN